MCADVYTVGLALETSGLQRGAQQSRTLLEQIIQQETRLERQSQQTSRALQTHSRELATTAARLREHARAAKEAGDVKLADTLNAQARALATQSRELRTNAAAQRDQAQAARQAASAARAQQAAGPGGLGGAALGLLRGGVGGGITGVLGGLAGGVAVSGILMAATSLKTLMESASSTATEMLNLHNRLTATAGSAAGGAREFQQVSGLANRLGVDIIELAGQYAAFTAAIKGTTLEGAKGRLAFEQISAGLARMGLSSEATHRALSALQQMVSKGTVAAEELRGQWGEAVPGGLQIAARAMGVTTADLGRLAEQGKLTGTVMVESLGRQMASETGPALERVGAGATRLSNVLQEISATMLGPVVRATDKAQGSLASFLAGVFKTSSAMDTLRQTFAQWAGVTAEQSKLVTDQQIADLERGTNVYQTEYQKRQQIVAGFHKAIADAEQEARLRATEGVMMGGGPLPTLPFATDIAAATATRQAASKQVAGIGRFDRLSTELGKAKAQLQAVEKAYEELTAQMIKMPTLETSAAFMAQRTELEKQAITLRATVTAMEEKAEADKQAAAASRSLAEREVDLQLRYQARNIALKAGTEAGEAYEDRTNSMSEAEQRAEAHHLRRSSAINAENRALERAAKATQAWKEIEDELNRAFDRATMKERDAFIADLEGKLLAVNLALAETLTLEEAIQRIEMDRLSATDAGFDQLIAQYDAVNKRLALYRALRGEGTAGLGPAEAIETFRQRGLTQGVVEGEPGPLETRLNLVATATNRFATELRQARRELLDLGGPEVVKTFDDLVIKRFGAATESLYEFEDGLWSIRAAAEEVAGAVLSSLQRLTTGGKLSFRELASSIVQDLLSILQQKFLQPQLTKWIELAITAGINLLRGLGGAGAGVNLGTALGGTGGLQFGQSGGPLRRGLTLVGEAGPEVIATRGTSSLVFPSSHPLSRMAVRAHLPGRQFGGPLPTAIMGTPVPGMGQTSMEGSGSREPAVIVNVYTQDAPSFLRSRGEVQRAMLQAFRAAQRS